MKECEGCWYFKSQCTFVVENHDRSCPCSFCVVKVICRNTCDEWFEWSHRVDCGQ